MDFGAWLASTQKQRDALDAYGASERPMDAVERSQDIQKAIQASDAVGRLLADAESFLTQSQAQAVLAMRDKYPDFTAKEREKMERDHVRGIQRLVHGLEVTAKTLSNRIFSILNANRSRL